MLIKINPKNPQERLITKVVDILKKGGIIAYPTDTYYGIGCDIMNKKAIEKIYQLKQRNRIKPFSFICSGLKNISHYAKVSNYAYKTMKRLLPGPYTFVLEGSKLVPKIMLTKRKTAGIRMPDHPICLELVEKLGNPIITTSVRNPENKLFNDAEEIAERLKGKVDLVVDGGRISPHHSTIIDMTGNEPLIEREGKGDVSFLME